MSDTNEISKGCLTHYDNRHIQVRLDFLGLCAYDKDLFDEKRKEEPNQECMAKILRLFETLTDHARTGWQLKAINAKEKGLTIPQEPKEYRFELTNGAIISLIYNTFGESTVRNSLDYLIHLGYIGRYQEKKNSIPVYWLNTQKIQPLLKEQAENELSGFEITPQTPKGLKSHPKRPKSNPSSTISNPKPPKSDTPGFESTDNNISNNKDNITEKERNERESPPNTLDTTAIVSSDTARSQFSLIEAIFFLRKHSYTIEPFAQRKDVFVLQYPSGKEVHISAENIITEADAVALGEAFDTARASLSQDEEMFRNDAPQGDTHATAASGHPHRVGEPAAPGGDSDHGTVDNGQVATPEAGPVLEAQEEITEGDTHATRVPTVPRADHPTPGERDAAGHPQSAGHCAVGRHDDLPVVHPVGCGTSRQEDRAGRAQDRSVAEKDPAKTLAQKEQTDGNQPCTSRSHPDGSREHMRLPGNSGSRDLGTPYQETLTETPTTSTPAQSLPLPQAEQAASGTPKPLVEPDMSGKWSHEKCVEYAEWCNQRRYTEKMHEEQLKAAHAIHKNDVVLTLEQFKQAYDERNDAWWKEHKGKLHVNDMKARGASGIDRVHEMLQRIEDAVSKCRAQTPRALVPAPSPNQPITNIRELVRQRELLRQQQAVGV